MAGTREIEGFKTGIEALCLGGFVLAARGVATAMQASERRKVAAIRASIPARVAARTAQLVAAAGSADLGALDRQMAASRARLRAAGVA